MKTYLALITFCFAGVFFMSSCDKIEDPLKNYTPDTTATGEVLRNVIIEDYTGHMCKNCPLAAHKLEEIEQLYGDRVIGIAVHAGPSNFVGVTTDYPEDFTTAQGTKFYGFFGFPGLPYGMVSRTDYTPSGTAHLKSYTKWAASATTVLATKPATKIEASVGYEANSGLVTVDAEITVLENLSDDIKINVMLVESNIIGPQLMPDNTRNAAYVFNDVLRTMFTADFGDALASGPLAPGQKFTKTITGVLKPEWLAQNCEIIIYVSNARTYEMLQGEKVAVKP